MNARRWSLTLLIALIAGMLAACGGGTQGGAATTAPAAGGDGAAATTAPAAGGEAAGGALPAECSSVALDYWNPFTGPDGPFMGTLTDSFNAANPNIQVTMTSQAEYYTQLGTAAASNSLPDVAIVHADQVATQAFRNVIRPIDDLVSQVGVSGGDFPEAVWAAGEVAGQRYAIPLDIHPMTMFYNADLVATPPTTGDEFTTAAQGATSGDNKGFLITSGFPVQQIFSMLLHQYGGTWFNEDGTEATWNSEAGVRALQWMKDAQAAYSEPNLEVDAELNAFKAGTVGIIWNGIWQTTNVTGEAVEFNGMATAVPQIGDQPAVWAGSHQLALPAQPDEDPCRDAAAAIFIKYLLDNSVEWARAGQIPANNNVRSSDEFLAVEPQASIAPSVENAIFPPSVPGITDAFGPLEQAVSAVMAGTATDIQAALDEAATAANQILAENQQNYGDAPAGAGQ
jgi:multiple sugar transport system substrate-binding protein